MCSRTRGHFPGLVHSSADPFQWCTPSRLAPVLYTFPRFPVLDAGNPLFYNDFSSSVVAVFPEKGGNFPG